MIYLAPYSVERYGVCQGPHSILAIRNGRHENTDSREIPIDWNHGPEGALVSIENHLAARQGGYVVLGGDHLITLGILRARYRRSGEPTYVVMYDAHTDRYGVPTDESLNSGNWLQVAEREGLVAGVCHNTGGRYDMDNVVQPEDIPEGAPIHLTVDLDVMQPHEIGYATPYPEPGGFSTQELLEDIEWWGEAFTADLTEYDAARDHTQAGGQVAVRILDVLERLVHNFTCA